MGANWFNPSAPSNQMLNATKEMYLPNQGTGMSFPINSMDTGGLSPQEKFAYQQAMALRQSGGNMSGWQNLTPQTQQRYEDIMKLYFPNLKF